MVFKDGGLGELLVLLLQQQLLLLLLLLPLAGFGIIINMSDFAAFAVSVGNQVNRFLLDFTTTFWYSTKLQRRDAVTFLQCAANSTPNCLKLYMFWSYKTTKR